MRSRGNWPSTLAAIIGNDVTVPTASTVSKEVCTTRRVDCMNVFDDGGPAYMVTTPTAAKLTMYFARTVGGHARADKQTAKGD
jgi:hypothetical protein